MTNFTNKCPNCAGILEYRTVNKRFVCTYCKSEYQQSELPEVIETEAVVSSVEMYNCNSCGAEIICDATQSSSTCVYCHSPVVLSNRVSGAFTPEKIIPFALGHEHAEFRLDAWINEHKYVKRDFVDLSKSELKGVYIPFWLASGNREGKINASGTKSNDVRIGDYIERTTNTYHLVRDVNLDYSDQLYKALDKKTMDMVAGIYPFRLHDLKPYSIHYLSGYYSEMRNIEAENFEEIASKLTKEKLDAYLHSEVSSYSGIKRDQFLLEEDKSRWMYTLLPVWFFTYNYKKKPYYFVMNGQTGAIAGRLPIQYRYLFRDSLFKALIFFVVIVAIGMVMT